MSIELFCCERCARKAKEINRNFEIMNRIFFLPEDVPECDICGDRDAVLRCYDHQE